MLNEYLLDLRDAVETERKRLAETQAMLAAFERGTVYGIERLHEAEGYVLWDSWRHPELPTVDQLTGINRLVYDWLIGQGYTVTVVQRSLYLNTVATGAWQKELACKHAGGRQYFNFLVMVPTIPGTELNIIDTVWVLEYSRASDE